MAQRRLAIGPVTSIPNIQLSDAQAHKVSALIGRSITDKERGWLAEVVNFSHYAMNAEVDSDRDARFENRLTTLKKKVRELRLEVEALYGADDEVNVSLRSYLEVQLEKQGLDRETATHSTHRILSDWEVALDRINKIAFLDEAVKRGRKEENGAMKSAIWRLVRFYVAATGKEPRVFQSYKTSKGTKGKTGLRGSFLDFARSAFRILEIPIQGVETTTFDNSVERVIEAWRQRKKEELAPPF